MAKHSTILDMIYIKMNDRYFSSGFGYFTKLKSPTVNRINIYAAFSSSGIHNHWAFVEEGIPDDFFSSYTKAHYNSFYLGADAIYEDRNKEFAWTLRYCHSRYDQFEFHNGEMTNTSSEPISSVENLSGNNLETYWGVAWKWKKFKASLQLGLSLPVTKANGIVTDTLHVGPNIFTSSYQENFSSAAFLSKLSIQYSFDFSGRKN